MILPVIEGKIIFFVFIATVSIASEAIKTPSDPALYFLEKFNNYKLIGIISYNLAIKNTGIKEGKINLLSAKRWIKEERGYVVDQIKRESESEYE